MRDERWEMRDERWEVRAGRWEMRDERWEMRDERWEMRDGGRGRGRGGALYLHTEGDLLLEPQLHVSLLLLVVLVGRALRLQQPLQPLIRRRRLLHLPLQHNLLSSQSSSSSSSDSLTCCLSSCSWNL
eukprot:177817-Hanusia_phi.AAC.1